METPKALNCVLKCESCGKIAFMQEFELPKCGNVETYFLFGAKHKPVIVFPLTKNYEVIAVKHFRYGANCYVLEVPGGNMEGKTTIGDTAKRSYWKKLVTPLKTLFGSVRRFGLTRRALECHFSRGLLWIVVR